MIFLENTCKNICLRSAMIYDTIYSINITIFDNILQEDRVLENGKMKEKNRMTKWLERNIVWFATLLPLCVSIVIAVAAIASCRVDMKQAQLAAIEIEKQNKEKQPFFSIKQEYDTDKEQYIYSVYNTGGEVRYSNLYVMPFLYLSDSRKGDDMKCELISLPGFYQYEQPKGDEILAFSDRWVNTDLIKENMEVIYDSKFILADNYLIQMCSEINYDMDSNIFGRLVYKIQISYYDYKNQPIYDEIWCGRSSDISGKTEGNNFLFIDNTLKEKYRDGDIMKSEVEIDSLNISTEETMAKCRKCLEDFAVRCGG